MEKLYIGCKIIGGEPMREKEFAASKGITWNQNRKDNPEGYKVRYRDGYVSWSPKEEFELAYREISEAETAMIMNSLPGWPPAPGLPERGEGAAL